MVGFLHDWYYELYDSAHAWYRGLRYSRRWLIVRQFSRFALLRTWARRFLAKRSSAVEFPGMLLSGISASVAVPQSRDRPIDLGFTNIALEPSVGSSVDASVDIPVDISVDISVDIPVDISVEQIVRSVQQDGYFLGLQLSVATVEAILHFAEQQPCLGNRYPEIGFYYAEKQQAEAHYQTAFVTASYFNTALTCPTIAQLGQDPVLRSIAAAYLGTEPVLISSRLWWSFPGAATLRDRRKSAQMFHYDRDDFGLLKFFFYLTDVDEAAGPHVCVRGTHQRKRWRHEWFGKQFSEAEMIRAYGAANVITVCGRAGFGFAEDTFCFHRAMPPQKSDRLILQLEYALTDYGMERDTIDPERVQVFTAKAS